MSNNNLFQDQLLHSLQYGFIDREIFQEGVYSPKILINDTETHRYVLNDIQEELSKAQSFAFSVAFITQSGLALIKSQLSDLADEGSRENFDFSVSGFQRSHSDERIA